MKQIITLSSVTIHSFSLLNHGLFQNINNLPFAVYKDADSLAIFIPRGIREWQFVIPQVLGKLKDFRGVFCSKFEVSLTVFITQRKRKRSQKFFETKIITIFIIRNDKSEKGSDKISDLRNSK